MYKQDPPAGEKKIPGKLIKLSDMDIPSETRSIYKLDSNAVLNDNVAVGGSRSFCGGSRGSQVEKIL